MRQSLLFIFVLFTFSLSAQNYSRLRVTLDKNHTIQQLAQLGVETDHGNYAPFKHLINDFSKEEIAQIKAAGFKTETLIDDLEWHAVAQNYWPENTAQKNASCDQGDQYDYPTPINYSEGSMGGYFTYQEMLDILDDMATQFPNLITQKAEIGNIETHEGRPIHWIRISDNPNQDENEPEVLYTALHHAREPNSLSQMLFFMWHVLENYETDDEIKYLVDNTELYFIPCVNPDGYVYNETTNPDGGGFWRKNRRDNQDGTFGVDLNRNYGYQWGFDNTGSSPNTASGTYRGPGPFSEPETDAVRIFCESHEIQIALNYHTHGNLLIYPWGYSDSVTDDHDTFSTFAEAMNQENDFVTGTGTQTVGYIVNGDSDDWMYGENVTKNAIFSMTPEVGVGFWPAQSEIDQFNKSTMLMNKRTAHLVHNFGLATDLSPEIYTDINGELNYSLKKYGLKAGLLSVYLEPVSDNIIWVGSPQNYGLVEHESVENAVSFLLSADIENNEEVVFNLVVDNGIYAYKETITKIYSDGTGDGSTEIFGDDGNDISNWIALGDWDSTTEQFFSAPSSITDSPAADYNANITNTLLLEAPLDLINVEAATISFWARWDIENDYDYVQCLISVNSGAFVPMCGKYTNLGSQFQDQDQPLYDAQQNDWVKEEIDLSNFVDFSTNPSVSIQFVFVSDGGVEADGFYFDDMAITIFEEETTEANIIELNNFTYESHPNPARDFTLVKFSENIAESEKAEISIFNALGQPVFRKEAIGIEIRVNTKGWEAGIYFYQLRKNNETLDAKRLSVVR